MKPLVEATVADATGVMKVVFFNQPWLERRYPPGTRLALYGKYDGRNRSGSLAFRDERRRRGRRRASPTTRRPRASRRRRSLALVRAHRGARSATSSSRCPRRLRVAERLPDRAAALAAVHFGDARGAAARAWRSTSCCCSSSLLLRRRAAPQRGDRAPALDGPRELTARWLAERCRSRRPATSARRWRQVDADLAATRPMQRLLMGEVGSGKTVVALYAHAAGGRARDAGRADGADRDARRAALRDAAGADPGEPVPAALLTGSTPGGAARRRAGQARPAASCRSSSGRTR